MSKIEDLSNVPASVIKQQKDAERKIEALATEPTVEPETPPVDNTEQKVDEPVIVQESTDDETGRTGKTGHL